MDKQYDKKNRFSLTRRMVFLGLILFMSFSIMLPLKKAEAQGLQAPGTTRSSMSQAFTALAGAAGGGIPTMNIWQQLWEIISASYEAVEKAYDDLGEIGFKTALRKMVGNIAVDTATFIATGDAGQKSMFHTDFLGYMNQEADAFLGNALNNELQKMWGVNLCEPPDALFKVKLEIKAKEYFKATRPQCTFTKMWKNIRDPRELRLVDLPEFADMFNPSSNELGMFLQVTTQLEEGKRLTEEEAKLKLLIEQGWKAVTSPITGSIKTPASIVRLLSEEPLRWAFNEKEIFTGNLAADFIGPFANTLVSKLIQQYKEGLVDDEGRATGLGGAYGPSFGRGAIQAAKEKFANLGETEYIFGGKFDVVNWLSCENPESQYTCVIDDGLKAAILEEPHLTVGAALKGNLLHGDWAFGYRSDKSGGTANVQRSIYSYRSLVVLRKYRVIPVGWELAAEYYEKYDNTGQALTLNKLVNEYDNSDSPYYRLVDPGWVLKAPAVICEKQGPGELAVDETIALTIDINQDGEITDDERQELVIRKDYCADERSCIKESLNGEQCEYYGYCVEENPIWRIRSNNGECLGIDNSCQAYTTRSNQQVAYLTNTLWGADACGAENVGCREYCSWVDIESGEWDCDFGDTLNRIYLNRQASDVECSQDNDGCSEFIRVSSAALVVEGMTREEAAEDLLGLAGEEFDTIIDYDFSAKTNMRKAPDYLECEGYTVEVDDISDEASCSAAGNFWRYDIEQCVESGHFACGDYALYCSADDAGCEFYTPVSYSGPSVPGVVGSDDICPAECVGYKTYSEQESFIDPNQRFVDLIPATAQSCSAADSGCEEFTNLSEGSEGEDKEYYSKLRSCVLPGSAGTATYYTWASSDEAGNQLRAWELLANTAGYPCTNPNVAPGGAVSCGDGVIDDAHICTFGNSDPDYNPVYNPDCVEFISQTGASYWVHFSRIIMSNDDCVPMRRTFDQTDYFVSPSLSQSCSASSNGCREYKGSAANNIQIILDDDFESGTNEGWDPGENSNESLMANGHSLYSEGVVGYVRKDVSDLIGEGRSYSLSFWAKGSSISRISLYDEVNGVYSSFDSGVISLNDEWGYYTVALYNLDREITDEEYLLIESGDQMYLDNIRLTETQDDLYLIRDSWETPLACDNPIDNPTADPVTSPGEMVGCEEYRDAAGESQYLKSFEKLCQDEVVGCELVIDTFNSDEPGSETFGDVVVEEDELAYVVYDRDKLCGQVGCRALGLIEGSRQQSPLVITTKYLVVEPDDFGGFNNPLCLAEEVWCDEFTSIDEGTPNYFKNPNVFTCEYKEVGGSFDWYQTGSDIRCLTLGVDDSQGHCVGGRSMVNAQIEDNYCAADYECSDYASFVEGGLCSTWTGICPVSEDNCTEYQDPTNPEGCDKLSVNGELEPDSEFSTLANPDSVGPYCDFYYYKSDKVDTASCNSQISLDEGCRGFHQTDGGEDVWYSTARCSESLDVPCESDADCVDGSGTSLGRCIFNPGEVNTFNQEF